MLTLQFVGEFIHEYFEDVVPSKNGTHFLARCLLCGDSKKSKGKKRFNLDYNNGKPMWHCFNYARSGSFLQLYARLKGISTNEAEKKLFGFDPAYLTKRLYNRKKKRIIHEIGYTNHNYLLNDCVSKDMEVDSIRYNIWVNAIDQFRKDRYIPENYKIFYAYKGDYKGRFIIPIYDDNKDIIFFQARKLPGSNIMPKYKNPSLSKGYIVFNEYKFRRDKYIIVTEGLIDSMMIENQGTTCLGSFISDDFMDRISKLTDKGIIIAFDNDKPGFDSLEKFMKESKYSKVVKYFLMSKAYDDSEDINKCVVKHKIEDVYSFVLDNSYSYISAYSRININSNKRF